MAAGWSTVTKENTNFARLCKLLIDGGTQVLRDIFDGFHSPCDLKKHLIDPANHRILKNLKSKGILRPEQWSKLYPSVGTVSSASFDITLLSLLLRNICNLPAPAKGWNDEPSAASISQGDDIVRIKLYRNILYGHISKPALSDADFTKYWSDIETVYGRLCTGRYKADIDYLRTQSLDPEDETYFIQCLKEWADNEEKIMRKLEELLQNVDEVNNKMEQLLNMTKSTPERTTEDQGGLREDILQDVEMYSTRLKNVIKKRTEMQLKEEGLPFVQSTKTDDIFTNLTVYHGKQRYLQLQRGQKDEHARKILTEIKKCSEIFVDEKEENPKSILVAGDPGIGKTLFSQKLVRDWATNSISIPNIKFTYLLAFRQLNLLDEEKLNLRELLNRSSLLNESTIADQSIIDYIFEHPQQLFVVIDGMDEYKDRHKIASDFESQFPNDVKAKMPVTALVSKLLQKKILGEAVTMVTSRVGAANEMDKKIHFDRYVEISGFSESQVLEYVRKFFDSKSEDVKTQALQKVKETEHYMTFGRVPFMSFLMCIVIEWEITNNLTSKNSVPLTLTDFYRYVIDCIESYYNRGVSSLVTERDVLSAVTKTLDNFSRLAVQLFEQDKFSFSYHDLEKLNLTESELLHLQSSKLLCCNPVASNSPFPKITHDYSFNHFSFQEFFAARYFVSKNEIPAKEMSELIFQFMSGLMDPQKNEELMLKLLECIGQQVEGQSRQRLISFRCLYEYKDGGDVLTRTLSENSLHRYWDSGGKIRLEGLNDSDCKPVAMVVDKFADASLKLTELPSIMYIDWSSLTCSGLKTLMSSLTNPSTTITGLALWVCELDDECAQFLSQHLSNTKITVLQLNGNQITDEGIQYITESHCPSKLTRLNLSRNPVTDECKKRTRQLCKDKYPDLKLEIY